MECSVSWAHKTCSRSFVLKEDFQHGHRFIVLGYQYGGRDVMGNRFLPEQFLAR